MKILPTFVQAAKLPAESGRSTGESTSTPGRSISSSTLAFMTTTENLVDDLCMGLECGLVGRKRQEKNRVVVSREDLQLYGTTVLQDAYKLTDERNHSLLHSIEDDAATFSDASSSLYSGITFESGTTEDEYVCSNNEIEIDLIGVPSKANDAGDDQIEQPLPPSTTSAAFELDTILSNVRISAIEVKVDETRATRLSNGDDGLTVEKISPRDCAKTDFKANRPGQIQEMADERSPSSETGKQLTLYQKFSPSRERKRPRKRIMNQIKKTTKQSRKALQTRIKKSVETAKAQYSRNQTKFSSILTARTGSQTVLEEVSTTNVEEVLKHRKAAQMWSLSVMKQAQEEKHKKDGCVLRPPTQRLPNAWILAMDNILDDSLAETIESSSLSGTGPRTRQSDETSTPCSKKKADAEVVVAPSSVCAQRTFHRKAGAALVNFLSRHIRLKRRRKNGNDYQRANES